MPSVAALDITEIMYNPVGEDTPREFVEVHGTDNLTGYWFGDLKKNQSLTLVSYYPGNFSLIVADSFDLEANASVYSVGAKLGNGLGNSGDTVFLGYNGSVISQSYTSSAGNGDGRSLEFVNGTQQASSVLGGTPGYFALKIVPPCVVDVYLSLSTRVVNVSEQLGFTFDIASENYTLEYWVSGEGGVVKDPHNSSSSRLRTFTAKEAGLHFVSAHVYACGNVTFIEEPFFVRGERPALNCSAPVVTLQPVEQEFSVVIVSNLTFMVNDTSSVLVNVTAGGEAVSGSLWAYAYAHSVSLSGERDGNAQPFSLEPGESMLLDLPLTVEKHHDDPSFKVQWQKDGYSSVSEERGSAVILLPPEPVIEEAEVNATTLINDVELPVTGHVVYEAPSAKLPYLGTGLLALVVVCGGLWLIIRKWRSKHEQSLKLSGTLKHT